MRRPDGGGVNGRRFAFAGRTCLITGAAGGIGAALALDLAHRRAALVLVDRDAAGLAQVAERARQTGAASVDTHVVDLADGGDRLDLAAAVSARHGGLDLLVNNAGVALSGTFEQTSMADFDWLMEINLRAVVRMTKAFLPQLLARPGSHVVNMSSLFGLIAPASQVAYSTSKYAVRGFSEALRHELDGRVGVTVVHPGGVRTGIARNARISGPDPDGARLEEARRFSEKALTLPPEEAARLIVAAVQARRPRLVVSRAAKSADLLARVAPGRYWDVIRRLGKATGY
jgi:short-subunit dehydrogenase